MPPLLAAEWYYVGVNTPNTTNYFDAATIEKTKNSVTVWVKTFRHRSADDSGAWATATRFEYKCSQRTIQVLAASDYNREGDFIKSYPASPKASLATPDSVGDGLLEVFCSKGFPKKEDKIYFKIVNNDPLTTTKQLVEVLDSERDSAPQ